MQESPTWWKRDWMLILSAVCIGIFCPGCSEEKSAVIVAAEPVVTPVLVSKPVDPVAEIRKTANEGNPRSMFLLGYRYERGLDVPQVDYVEAVRWYRKAAELGNDKAMFHLGRIYAGGYGVPQDYTEAYKWLHLSVVNGGNVDASKLRDVIQKSVMTPEQVETGLKASRKWQATALTKK